MQSGASFRASACLPPSRVLAGDKVGGLRVLVATVPPGYPGALRTTGRSEVRVDNTLTGRTGNSSWCTSSAGVRSAGVLDSCSSY
jgi:hypothetical protein